MKRGTAVVYINDPLLLGIGSIVGICKSTGKTQVTWTDLATFAHDPHDLVALEDFNAAEMFGDVETFDGITFDDLSVEEIARKCFNQGYGKAG